MMRHSRSATGGSHAAPRALWAKLFVAESLDWRLPGCASITFIPLDRSLVDG